MVESDTELNDLGDEESFYVPNMEYQKETKASPFLENKGAVTTKVKKEYKREITID